MLTPDFVKLSHNGASDAQASVYLRVGVAIGIYVRAQVCKPGYCLYCLIVNMDCSWSNSSSNILDLRFGSSFYYSFYKRQSISMIFGRHIYRVNLQHNNYFIYPPHLCAGATLPWGNNCRVIASATKVIRYCCTKLKKKYPVYPHNRSALEPKYFRMFFFVYTGLKSLTPFINSIVDNALQRASIKRCLMSPTSSTGVILIHSILHHAPYLIVNWIEIGAILRPSVGRNEL